MKRQKDIDKIEGTIVSFKFVPHFKWKESFKPPTEKYFKITREKK